MLSPRYAVVGLLALAACTTKEARRPDTAAPAAATLAGSPAPDVAAVRQAIEAANARFDSAAVKGATAALASFYAEDAVRKYRVLWKKQADGSYKMLRDIANSDQEMK